MEESVKPPLSGVPFVCWSPALNRIVVDFRFTVGILIEHGVSGSTRDLSSTLREDGDELRGIRS
jgi:hypothetical protein